MPEFGDLLVPLKERRLLVLGILVLGIRLYLAVPLSSRVD